MDGFMQFLNAKLKDLRHWLSVVQFMGCLVTRLKCMDGVSESAAMMSLFWFLKK
jgi:hypothetical protein